MNRLNAYDAKLRWRIAGWVLCASLLGGCAASGPATAPGVDTGARPAGDSAADVPSAGEVAAGVPASDPDSYRLGQGDRISIQVFDEPDLTMESRVGGSGVINYSYLGNLVVADKTPQQLEQEITALLQDGYLVNPSVNVTVLDYRPFFINGEVRSPGSYPYQPGLTLDKAIALAGGLTDRASTSKMFVSTVDDEDRERRASMSTRLAPGDIVSIKEGFF